MQDQFSDISAIALNPNPLSQRDIRAVLIDLDGTMVDTAPDFKVALDQMRAEYGLGPLALETIVTFVGKGSEHLVRKVLGTDFDAAAVEQHHAAALASYLAHYRKISGQYSSVYPGVREGLDAMRAAGLRLACVTNKPEAYARELLAHVALDGYFELVYGGDTWPRRKPDPMPMQKACEAFALPPEQVLAIGDSSNDAEAARAAGCVVLSVPYGYNHGLPVQSIDSDGIVLTLLDASNLIAAAKYHPDGIPQQ